jgi:aerobic carbon-monoxide dehydrogenase medium subunit
MIPPEFEYRAPESLTDVFRLLARSDEAKPLAGGQSLLPLMKLRLSAPSMLIDLRLVPGLQGVARSNGSFELGALTRHAELASRPELGLAAQAASLIADQQVRNRGTIGGTLAHADPAADLPTIFLTLEGSVLARRRFRKRTIGAGELFRGELTTALEPGELITRVWLPALDGYGYHYEKFTRRSEDWAIVGVAAVVAVRNGICEDVRVGLTNMGAAPLRAFATETALLGTRLDDHAIASAAEHAADETDPPADLHATPEYKRRLACVLTRRALERTEPEPQVRPAQLRTRESLAVLREGGSKTARRTGKGGGLELEQSFEIGAPIEQVWDAFVDLRRVADCLPGAEITGQKDSVFEGNFRVKVGPASASYQGTVRLESVDEKAKTLVLRASGNDKRGQGSASATMSIRLHQADRRTRVEVGSNINITGTLARFGRSGMIEDVANVLMRQFAACVDGKLTGRVVSPRAQAIRGGALFLSLLKARVSRLLSRL